MAKRKVLTVKNVKDQIKFIKEKAETDFESAYSWEISLYQDVLHTIANDEDSLHDGQMIELAAEALKAAKIKFKRATA